MDRTIYGTGRIAEALAVDERTVRRQRAPGGPLEFISVGSMSSAGGRQGRAAWTYVSSLDAAQAVI